MRSYKETLTGGQSRNVRRGVSNPVQKDAIRSVPIDTALTCPPLSCRIVCQGDLNPFQATAGERLPEGDGRNYHGLLICHLTCSPALNIDLIQQEAARLHDHTVIASFVGKKINPNSIADWIQLINKRLSSDCVSFKMDMGRGFVFLSTSGASATRKLLALSPHATP